LPGAHGQHFVPAGLAAFSPDEARDAIKDRCSEVVDALARGPVARRS